MAKRTTSMPMGGLPRVDLLPERQRAERRHERVLPLLLLALVVTGVVTAGIWVLGTVPGMHASAQLSRVQEQSAALDAQISQLGETQRMLRAVDSREDDRRGLTETEVMFIDVREQVLAALVSGAVLTSFQAELAGAGDTDVETGVVDCVGTGLSVTLTVAAPSTGALSAAAALLEGMRQVPSFRCGVVVQAVGTVINEAPSAEVTLLLGFDETVRAGRFASEGAQ